MSADGSGVRQLTNSRYDNAWPQWSPDDSRIVFSSTRDKDWEIYAMRADGTDQRRLTASPGRDAHASFLPGGRLVFQSPRNFAGQGEVDLYTMNADGTRQRRLLTAPGFDGVAVPGPTGEWIAYQRGMFRPATNDYLWNLRLVDSLGARDTALTSGTFSSQVPSWSPDGRTLVFYANPQGRDQLFLMDLATRAVRPLASSPGEDRAPSFSPDGARVAFTSTRDGGNQLFVLDVAAGTTRRLFDGLEVMGQPGWSRDGRRLVFNATYRGTSEVFVGNVDGTSLVRLTKGYEGTR